LLLLFFITHQAGSQTLVKDYINKHLEIAQKLMREHKVPASIVLGVAIHESAAGKSKVARMLNNHFGVKGKNDGKKIRSAYKGYETSDESFEHFASFLQTKPSYNKLFGTLSQYDYKNWAKGIQRGGYASSKTWASQVISLINKYELYQYDDRPENYLQDSLMNKEPEPEVTIVKKSAKAKKTYVVKKGDNLGKIAKRVG
ncbi:MAG: hemagglutinin, partial [Pedobacter sp.]